MSGIFYCGDNLEILTELNLVPPESVDLIYLDPPFNSQRTYNIVYKDSRAQEEAFKDHWSWEEAAPQYAKLLDSSETPPKLRTLLRGLRELLIDDDADLLAYIAMMAPRLFALHRTLKPTGSLYLHCDPTASHYLKMVLDAVFGVECFQNEIIWERAGTKNDPRRFGRSHDVLLFYSKTKNFTWTTIYEPFQDYSVAKNYTAADPDGRRYRLSDLTANKGGGDTDYEWHGKRPYKGRHWAFSRQKMDAMLAEGRIVFRRTGMPVYKRYLDEMPGVPLHDVWKGIRLASASAERIGYPTQKPVALLERIIQASSSPGDLVLDPFCGCGTSIEACEQLGRRWIGIDIAAKAVEITEARFKKQEWELPEVKWYPPDRDAAEALAKRRNGGVQFETWALRKIRAAKLRKRDRGIDGEAFFRNERGKLTHVLVSVKSGKLTPAMVRELRGTMAREKETIGAFVCLHEPSKEMKLEATRAGFLDAPDEEGPIPRLQFVTVDRIFSDRRPIRAPGVNVTEMPQGIVPDKVPEHEQLSLRLEPPKPPRKAAAARTVAAPAKSTRRAVAKGTSVGKKAASAGRRR